MTEIQNAQSNIIDKADWEKPEFLELSTQLTEGGKGITGGENTTTSTS